jgi:hypothetical protein
MLTQPLVTELAIAVVSLPAFFLGCKNWHKCENFKKNLQIFPVFRKKVSKLPKKEKYKQNSPHFRLGFF